MVKIMKKGPFLLAGIAVCPAALAQNPPANPPPPDNPPRRRRNSRRWKPRRWRQTPEQPKKARHASREISQAHEACLDGRGKFVEEIIARVEQRNYHQL